MLTTLLGVLQTIDVGISHCNTSYTLNPNCVLTDCYTCSNPTQTTAGLTNSLSLFMQGSMFSAILGDMLEAVRWPGDPSMAPGSPFRGSRQGKPESPSATRVRVPVGQIGTSTLAAHPTRQLFLTGLLPCRSMTTRQWAFNTCWCSKVVLCM